MTETDKTGQERERFEAAIQRRWSTERRTQYGNPWEYVEDPVNEMWDVWQARAALDTGAVCGKSSSTPSLDVDALAQEIRRVDSNHDLGAGALAEALMPFLSGHSAHPDAYRQGAEEMPTAWHDVIAERRRQISVEEWTPDNDDDHEGGEMALAAAAYAENAARGYDGDICDEDPPYAWPWADKWWKPTTRRRDLVKAGALILAEIERLDRASLSLATRRG